MLTQINGGESCTEEIKSASKKRKTGERGPDKKPRAKAKPRTSNKPKIPGAKVIVKATDELT
ncbi:MAG: hypothetical protein ABI210_05795, partial [Abditibacteriaceae bacterium]